MKHFHLLGLILLSAGITAAQAHAQSPAYETPEYSGPTARFDRNLDRYRDQENALRASRERLEAVQRDRRNDLAVDHQNSVRSQRVQEEMARKREESLRANQLYRLRTNE